MKTLPFYKKLSQKARSLTPSQQKLLEYILSHEDEVIFLTIKDLANRTNVSQATVVRLSQTLGFNGYPHFLRELRQVFGAKLATTSRLKKMVERMSDEEDVWVKILQGDMHNIAETMKENSIGEFRQFIQCIDSAERIIIIGLRSVFSIAIILGIALEFLQKNVLVIQPGIGDMWDRLMGLKKGDLVIAISFPRYTKETVEVIQFARSRGVKTLAITDSVISPLASYADHLLTARYKMDSFIESFTAPLSVINAIVTGVAIRRKRRTAKSLKELEEMWSKRGVFHNAQERIVIS